MTTTKTATTATITTTTTTTSRRRTRRDEARTGAVAVASVPSLLALVVAASFAVVAAAAAAAGRQLPTTATAAAFSGPVAAGPRRTMTTTSLARTTTAPRRSTSTTTTVTAAAAAATGGLFLAANPQQQDSADTTTTFDDANPLGLTPELLKVTNAFEAIGDDKLRYKQLLYMANQLEPFPEELKTPERKVPGCLSTVHVRCALVEGGEKEGGEKKVQFSGDSDGLLTKGLLALLVRGLSGNTPEAIQRVDPAFIQKAGIAQSLTPGRNNGFLNMLAVMKKQALDLLQQQQEEEQQVDDSAAASSSPPEKSSSSTPKYDAIVATLQKLQPVKLELVDNSHQHAGHAGNDMDGESHFDLYVVADAFDGLNLVKRHQLVYMLLGEIMPQIHALQIRAQTPAEAGM